MNVKKYLAFTVADFIVDEDFIRWVKDPKIEDAQFWDAFLLNHSDKSPEIKEAKTIIRAMMEKPTQAKLSKEEKAGMLLNMQQQIQQSQKQNPQVGSSKVRTIRPWRTIAAAVAVLLIGVATWFYVNETFSGKAMITTNYGQQLSIELPDGSQVKLNANSSLSFEKDWDDQDSRKVWLRGEAFFEVEKKMETGQKFQVITKDLIVEVLGTVFNVNSHQKETKVFLEEGKVKLSLKGLGQPVLMEPGELVAYSESKKELPKKRQVLPTVHTSWKDGLMLFDNTPLREVLEKVEEIYGVTIQSKDTTQYARGITTGVPVENLEEAFSILEVTMGLKILKEKNGFVIQ